MATKIEDGFLVGQLENVQRTCPICGQVTRCIDIQEFTFPPGLSPGATILRKRNRLDDDMPFKVIGLGCGDYAKLHRQIAHIMGPTPRRRRK